MPLGGSQNYLVSYNGYQLPGYLQQESLPSDMNIAEHYAPFADGSLSEYTGLQNKNITLRLKVWESSFLACKDQVELAATYLRSKRAGFALLKVEYSDRYYDAMVQSMRVENTAGGSPRLMEYEVTFSARPWLINVATTTISGTGTITTDQVSRTIADGGWTPATVTVTGTNVTISGYTAAGDFAGYMSVTGAVTGLVVDTENMTAKVSGNNVNDQMAWADYGLYVGVGKTSFVITGASSCSIAYHSRWYI